MKPHILKRLRNFIDDTMFSADPRTIRSFDGHVVLDDSWGDSQRHCKTRTVKARHKQTRQLLVLMQRQDAARNRLRKNRARRRWLAQFR